MNKFSPLKPLKHFKYYPFVVLFTLFIGLVKRWEWSILYDYIVSDSWLSWIIGVSNGSCLKGETIWVELIERMSSFSLFRARIETSERKDNRYQPMQILLLHFEIKKNVEEQSSPWDSNAWHLVIERRWEDVYPLLRSYVFGLIAWFVVLIFTCKRSDDKEKQNLILLQIHYHCFIHNLKPMTKANKLMIIFSPRPHVSKRS